MTVIAVLVPTAPGSPPGRPEDRPIGRAALALAAEGVDAVFGDTVDEGWIVGHRARPGTWEPARARPVALYDRFPSQRRADAFAAIQRGATGLPLANAPAVTLLCRDKLRCQRHLEAQGLTLPAVEDDPTRFADRLAAWGVAFLKPRYGALGAGVRRVLPGDALPARVRALLDDEPAILQRAVAPPAGYAGRSVRVLCQRLPDRSWRQWPAVVRQSTDDPVVNAARGAALAVGDDVLPAATRSAIAAAVDAVATAIAAHEDGALALELGVDLVLDPDGLPHVIEVNSRPRGRLEKLAALDADRFGALHVDACAQPIRSLAAWYG